VSNGYALTERCCKSLETAENSDGESLHQSRLRTANAENSAALRNIPDVATISPLPRGGCTGALRVPASAETISQAVWRDHHTDNETTR
jgi:hypothetical protein